MFKLSRVFELSGVHYDNKYYKRTIFYFEISMETLCLNSRYRDSHISLLK